MNYLCFIIKLDTLYGFNTPSSIPLDLPKQKKTIFGKFERPQRQKKNHEQNDGKKKRREENVKLDGGRTAPLLNLRGRSIKIPASGSNTSDKNRKKQGDAVSRAARVSITRIGSLSGHSGIRKFRRPGFEIRADRQESIFMQMREQTRAVSFAVYDDETSGGAVYGFDDMSGIWRIENAMCFDLLMRAAS